MGGKTSTTTQQVQIPKEVMERYNAVNKRAEGVATTPFQTYSTDPSAFVAPITQQQQSGIDAINQTAGVYQPYLDKAALTFGEGLKSAQPGALNVNQYMNPYQQQVVDATMRQMMQANEQAQSGALGTAIQSGAFGGDRAGIAAANLANQQGLAMGSTLAGLNSENYQQAMATAQQQQGLALGATQADLERMMSGGQFYAGLGQAAQGMGLQGAEAMLNAGTLGQQTEQAGKTALYNQFMQQQAYPFQVAQFLANIAMGTGALSGSTTTTTQPAPFFSDRRLKENIRRIGQTDDGLPIYKYQYKGEDQTHIGFMADEVEKKKPEAVGLHPTGYKTVDYDRATKAGGGGIAGPYGSTVGSQPGLSSYVPEAYLPVGELMVADGQMIDTTNQSLAGQAQAAASFGDSLSTLYDQYGSVKKKVDEWRQRQRDQADATPGAPSYRGGLRGGYAYGGEIEDRAEYLTPGLVGNQNPVDKKTYLSDTLESQGKADKPRLETAGGAGGSGSSPASGLGSLLTGVSSILPFLGFKDGGRAGYAAGGAPDERELEAGLRAALINQMGGVYKAPPAAQAPAPSSEIAPEGGLRGAAILAANAEQNMPQASREEFNRTEQAAPTATPQQAPTGLPMTSGAPIGTAGLAAAMPPVPDNMPPMETSARPQPRPAGLAAAGAPTAVDLSAAGIGVDKPVAASVNASGMDPRDFYRSNILRQESGHRQFDENGKPLTSSAGAVGIGQVMEGTGPEAAALAGLDWDRERWMYDADYNAAIGEAYFLEQYRRFGSLDKAAAAYNAGPGALSSALDRAAALGGSYLDYLPAETQNYVSSTTGMTGGGRREAGLTGGRGYMSTSGNLPAEDGTFTGGLGDFIRKNKSNPDFVLSVLSGLGTMASSPSLYLGSAILQGIGGAANTYMAREQQRGEITAKNLENMRAIAMDTMTWNEMNGQNLTPAEYARMIGANVSIPGTATAQDILSGAYTPTTGEDGIRKLGYQEFQTGTVDIGGREVRMQDDPASLNRFIQDNSWAPPDSPIGRAVERAQARLSQIEAMGGMTIDARTGEQFQIPGYVSVGDTQAKAAADREASSAFRSAAPEIMDGASRQLAAIGTMKGVYQSMEPGALAGFGSQISAYMSAIDPDNFTGWKGYDLTDPAQYQIALKGTGEIMAARLAQLPGGAPASSIDFLQTITPGPDMQPEAIKKLLAIAEAEARYKMDLYNGYDPAVHGTDITAYTKEFSQGGKRFEEYVKDAYSNMPLFAGEPLTAENAPDGSTSFDADGRPIIKRNGKWVYSDE